MFFVAFQSIFSYKIVKKLIRFEKKVGECDKWREKYEERAAASEHIATVEFETQETETRRTVEYVW